MIIRSVLVCSGVLAVVLAMTPGIAQSQGRGGGSGALPGRPIRRQRRRDDHGHHDRVDVGEEDDGRRQRHERAGCPRCRQQVQLGTGDGRLRGPAERQADRRRERDRLRASYRLADSRRCRSCRRSSSRVTRSDQSDLRRERPGELLDVVEASARSRRRCRGTSTSGPIFQSYVGQPFTLHVRAVRNAR